MNKNQTVIIGILGSIIIIILMVLFFRSIVSCPQYVLNSSDFCLEGKIVFQKDWFTGCDILPKCEFNQEIFKETLTKKFFEIKTQYKQAKVDGFDVSEIEKLSLEAKNAFDKGNYVKTNLFLDQIVVLLKNFKTSNQKIVENKKNLSDVKVAIIYESIIDGQPVNVNALDVGIIGPKRSIEEISKLLSDLHVDMVHRGFFRWNPLPESSEKMRPELIKYFSEMYNISSKDIPLLVKNSGYNYEQLSKSIKIIKEDNPNIIFVGAIAAQRINRIERNDKTGKIYTTDETWAMAFDPQKWGIKYKGKPFTKEQFQEMFARSQQWIKPDEQYDWKKADAYFPDITNSDFQLLFLSWAQKQVDSGVDAIWIDGLPQTSMFYNITKDIKHPMINDLYLASEKIIDGIHNYRSEKKVYVGAWAFPFGFVEGLPYLPPTIDFVTKTISNNEILNNEIDKKTWVSKIAYAKKVYNNDNVPFFAVIDWGADELPLFVFSQKLTNEKRKSMLKYFDEEFQKIGVNFVYPVHGGWMGGGATILSFGKWRTYDSFAPEFNTYKTIKELAIKKASK